ncbi:MAG TPA: hypothetical protein VGJ68_04750 [Bradyrhizobium sp.]|jgi:hypothetical protein
MKLPTVAPGRWWCDVVFVDWIGPVAALAWSSEVRVSLERMRFIQPLWTLLGRADEVIEPGPQSVMGQRHG